MKSLNGKTGFTLSGDESGDFTGKSVSTAGDIDGDGYDDIMIGAFLATPNSASEEGGKAYVFLGKKSGYSSTFDLTKLNGSNGFTFESEKGDDHLGRSVGSAGDIDGDGYDDMLMGAPYYEGGHGRAYAYWGKNTSFLSRIGLGTIGDSGFKMSGGSGDRAGWSVDTAGDINGDGKDDLLISAYRADAASDAINSGVQYVVFGKSKSDFDSSFTLKDLDGTDGFRLNGPNTNDYSGWSVSTAGDMNNDGYDDIIIGIPERTNTDKPGAFVYFGKSGGFTKEVELDTLNGSNGFKILGTPGNHLGWSVSNAGDINGDGFDDVVLGGPSPEEPVTDWVSAASKGEAYVLFGKKNGFSANLNIDSVDDTEGFRIEGIDAGDELGYAVNTAGDINNDGYDDIIIGAPGAASKKGESYVIFGGDFTGDSTVTGSSGEERLLATEASSYSISERRDNPITSGDESEEDMENGDTCFGTETAGGQRNDEGRVMESFWQGDNSDLLMITDEYDEEE